MTDNNASSVDEAISELVHSPVTSPWLKGVLQSVLADSRDPEEVARDVTQLAVVLGARARVKAKADDVPPMRYAGVDLWLPLVDDGRPLPHAAITMGRGGDQAQRMNSAA